MILDLIDEAVTSGARLEEAATTIDLSPRTVIRWKNSKNLEDRRKGPLSAPSNRLTPEERQEVISIANSPAVRDLSPKQIVPLLADQGLYIASESSFYRILRNESMINHRGSSKPAVRKRPKAYKATGPCQIWSWDITYLNTCIRGKFFYLYMIMDVWSRKIIAAKVHEKESMDLSASLLTHSCIIHNVNPENMILHSDNGGPMKGATMLATLQKLGIIPSFSRSRVSNDNAYSEALFKTMKYRPAWPSKPFESIQHAQAWVDGFVIWYNTVHLHSAIRYVTPDDRHYGRQGKILGKRNEVYENARKEHPERWASKTRNWEPVLEVELNPEKEQTKCKTNAADITLKKAA